MTSAVAVMEQEHHTDRRIQRTRRVLAEALILLTLERDYEAVTIRDIAARAGVGYATFFRHYPDKESLLRETLEVVIEHIVALMLPALEQDNHQQVGAALFSYAYEHTAICRVLLGARATRLLLARFVSPYPQEASRWSPPAAPGIPPEIAAWHRIAATLSLLRWWLDQGMPYPPEQMGAIYEQMIIRPTIATTTAR